VRLSILVIVALSVLASFAGAALAYSLFLQPKVYGGQAEFLLTASPELSDAAADRAILTQVEIVTSPTVLQPVAGQTGARLQRLEDAVSADMVGRTNILHITVADRDPGRAVRLTQLVASQYGRASAQPVARAERPQLTVTPLTAARQSDGLLQPQPLRALAAGALLGLLAAAVAVVALWRPWRLTRPDPLWT
jgi:capsular polysaccharide biosynthesis protein